jgi:hypothetical protein
LRVLKQRPVYELKDGPGDGLWELFSDYTADRARNDQVIGFITGD